MRARERGSWGLRLAVLVLAASAGIASVARAESPVVVAPAGVSLSPNGTPGAGGSAGSFGLLFPFDGRWSFGGALFAEDLGTGLGTLRDPNSGGALGTVADLHRWAYGGEWQIEARLHHGRRLGLMWGAGFGFGRQERDQRGQVNGAVSGVTASTSATFVVPVSHGHAVGVALAARRLFVNTAADPGRSTNWATAAFEWRWQGTPKE